MPDSVCGAGGASRRQEYTDVAIIGAGPAGATLARRLAETTNYRVTLLDRRALDRPQQGVGKCCGGLLAPDAQRSLARQGLILPLEILVDPQIFAVRTIDLHLPEERYYSRSYLNMDREKFDRWLLGLVPPEVRVHTDAVCRGVHRIGGSYAVDYQQGGEACRLYARCVVGADGGGSLVRRSLYGTHEIARYVAVQEWYADDSGSPFYGALFDEELTDCYGWLISKNDRLVLGAAFPQDNAAQTVCLPEAPAAEARLCFRGACAPGGLYSVPPDRAKKLLYRPGRGFPCGGSRRLYQSQFAGGNQLRTRQRRAAG